MRNRIATIKAIRDRDAFQTGKAQRENAEPRSVDAASNSPALSAPPRWKAKAGYAGLLMRTVVALLFSLALIYAANEMMVYLLK